MTMTGRFADGGLERVGRGAGVVDALAEGLGDDDPAVGEAVGEGVTTGGGELGAELLTGAPGVGAEPEQPLMIMAMTTARTAPETGRFVGAVGRFGRVTTAPP